jgi:glycosidase
MIKKGLLIALIFTCNAFLLTLSSQPNLEKVEPPHWWTGMKNDTLHLLFYGNELTFDAIECDRKDISIIHFKTSEKGDYCFVDLLLSEAAPGKIKFTFYSDGKKIKTEYLLKERKENSHPLGLNQSDLVYLITPDRFASGDDKNDAYDYLQQNTVNRDSIYGRHGGDLKGINDQLDYLEDLGITALWLNPVEINDQPEESYHGYAITDHYKIDPRFGNNEDYKSLVDECHKKNIKIIRDVVFNHFGSEHPLIKNLPDSSWINHWSAYTKTSYRATVMLDPYASESDKEIFSNGWFDRHMPDMNYTNNDLANYMIQNSIWWVEEYQIDAYRIDTYIYPDQAFMKRWGYELKNEYPNLFLFAETWVHGSAIQAWFAGGNKLNQGETYLDGVTDFQMYYSLKDALSQSFGWNTGVSSIYYTLVDDVLYSKPQNNVLFLDNHDLDRYYGSIDEDYAKFKMGIALLFTLRGIPSLYYGTEILMPYKGEHGVIRTDYPGGWPDDPVNKFLASGRDSLENEAFEYIKYLANWRKTSTAIQEGELVQYIPKKGHYEFARISDEEIVFVIVNQNDTSISINLEDYDDVLKGLRKYHAILGQMSYYESEKVEILPMSIQVLSFKKSGNEKSTTTPHSSE